MSAPRTERPLVQLSRGKGPAVHRYYDVPVEEPGGDRLIYFEFDDEAIPGAGTVLVCDGDGGNVCEVGRAEHAIGHIGASHAWLGRGRIGYCPHKAPPTITRIVNLDDGTHRDVDIEVRSFHPSTGLGIAHRQLHELSGEFADPRWALLSWDVTTDEVRPIVDVDTIMRSHPLRDQCDAQLLRLQNPKWSPDGQRLFAVLTNERAVKTAEGAEHPPVKIKSLVLVDADGSNLKYLGEFGHHPMWAPSGRYLIAHNPRPDGDGQDLVRFPLDGGRAEPFIEHFIGIHSSLDSDEKRVLTDVFDHPEPGDGSVLLYDVDTGRHEVLARGRHEKRDHQNGTHIHPVFARDESRIFFNHAATGWPQLYSLSLT